MPLQTPGERFHPAILHESLGEAALDRRSLYLSNAHDLQRRASSQQMVGEIKLVTRAVDWS